MGWSIFAIFSGPSVFSTMCSMGWPWQSQPGTYGVKKPRCAWDLFTKSLRILLKAWPMWMGPFAYGGPSCRMKGLPSLFFSSTRS